MAIPLAVPRASVAVGAAGATLLVVLEAFVAGQGGGRWTQNLGKLEARILASFEAKWNQFEW